MTVSVLISGTFDDEETARRAFDGFQRLHGAALLNLTGLALIFVSRDGHLEVVTAPHDPVAPERERDVVSFGQILGALLAAPLLGGTVGGTAEAVADKVTRSDLSAKGLRKHAGKILAPGKWAVVAYASQVAEQAIRTDLEKDAPNLAFWEVEDATADTMSSDAGVRP
jgi:uncharacterized membrane protein